MLLLYFYIMIHHRCIFTFLNNFFRHLITPFQQYHYTKKIITFVSNANDFSIFLFISRERKTAFALVGHFAVITDLFCFYILHLALLFLYILSLTFYLCIISIIYTAILYSCYTLGSCFICFLISFATTVDRLPKRIKYPSFDSKIKYAPSARNASKSTLSR